MPAKSTTGKPLTRQQISGKGRKSELDWDKFSAICQTLSEIGVKYKACDRHGFDYDAVQVLMADREKDGDDRWRNLWERSMERFRDGLEEEMHRRAVQGIDKPVFFKGKKVATVKEYSDRLLEVSLKGNRPEKFRDNINLQAEITGGVLVVPGKMSVEQYLASIAERDKAEGKGEAE